MKLLLLSFRRLGVRVSVSWGLGVSCAVALILRHLLVLVDSSAAGLLSGRRTTQQRNAQQQQKPQVTR